MEEAHIAPTPLIKIKAKLVKMKMTSILLLALGGFGFISSSSSSVSAEDITIINRCPQTIYVKNQLVNSPPFHLPPNSTPRKLTVNRIPTSDKGPRPRIWAHTGCNPTGSNCDTTEGYVSLAELNYDETGRLWYDVSQVDGYNLPITLTVPGGSGTNCRIATCNFNIHQNCPPQNKQLKDNKTVACRNDDRENPASDYVKSIKPSCPGAYTYSGDNTAGMRDCAAGNNNSLTITFC